MLFFTDGFVPVSEIEQESEGMEIKYLSNGLNHQ